MVTSLDPTRREFLYDTLSKAARDNNVQAWDDCAARSAAGGGFNPWVQVGDIAKDGKVSGNVEFVWPPREPGGEPVRRTVYYVCKDARADKPRWQQLVD